MGSPRSKGDGWAALGVAFAVLFGIFTSPAQAAFEKRWKRRILTLLALLGVFALGLYFGRN